MAKALKRKLYIVSYGMKFSHLTLESLAVLRRCDKVFSASLDKPSARIFLEQFGARKPRLILLEHAGQDSVNAAILREAANCAESAYLVYGNPAFINGQAQILALEAEARGMSVAYLDAVSSIDSLVTLFRLNIDGELRLIDAASFSPRIRLEQRAHTMVFSLERLAAPAAGRSKAAFLKELARAYPAKAAGWLTACYAGSEEACTIEQVRLRDLPLLLPQIKPARTLFIPANSAWLTGRSADGKLPTRLL